MRGPSATTMVKKAKGALPEDRYLDRELSWLAFNERVQELSQDPGVPLLERVRYCSIFASNLDEFFMVRVAGLKRRLETGLAVTGASGIPPRQVLELLRQRAHELQQHQAKVLMETLLPELLERAGIALVHWREIGPRGQEHLADFFNSEVFPVLTPLAVDPAHPFPYISGLALNLVVQMRSSDGEHSSTAPWTQFGAFGEERLRVARVKVPDTLPRFIRVPDVDDEAAPGTGDARVAARFVPLEDVIAANLGQLFPGMEIISTSLFRVTRNEDLEVEEDDAENLLHALERELLRRRFGGPVRLELEEGIDPEVRDWLVRELGVSGSEVVELPSPLDHRDLGEIADIDAPTLHFPPFMPRTHRHINEVETSKTSDIFAAIRKRDILLHHPYDSFSTSVQAFLEQAAADPQVRAIKQTLYRTSGDSPIVDALIDAAAAGKQVLALVEIKARFDEENNISWARKLEHAGVHVVYGIVGLKTHCKLSMVVRQEATGLRRYCHVGTGNYHPKTARLYEDYGLLTCDEQVGEDVTRLFNQLSGYAPNTHFKRLLVAPRNVRAGLVDLIEREIEHARASRPAGIRIKCNSMVDEAVIDALYLASQAGVQVDVVVRGICALRPGVPGLSENIRVRSILGRFLEHSRVFTFVNGGDALVYIGSADMMHRNLDRRVEALVSITDPSHKRQLIEMLDLQLADSTQSWHLGPEGHWERHYLDESGERLVDSQQALIAHHKKLRQRA
ncbi:MAG: RNA degradosome polyphosphate kinase [Dermabacter sp.]|nr:RNA degradosome polyphosphate kinase [Dermabacter sp.]